MTLRVHLFARARDLAGQSPVEVVLPDAATVGNLRHALAKAYPALRNLLERSAIAVNDEFAAESHPLHEHMTLAILPPVSGGRC